MRVAPNDSFTSFEIKLEFLSDCHIGTGQGRLGTIDAEIRRDPDGLPFVPAKSLVGVWRDACETVAATFDRAADRPGMWQSGSSTCSAPRRLGMTRSHWPIGHGHRRRCG